MADVGDEHVTPEDIAKLRAKIEVEAEVSDDLHLTRFLLGAGMDVDKAAVLHKECVLWRKQFAVKQLSIVSVHDELNTGKIIYPDIRDKEGRPTLVIRPRFVVKSQAEPLEFMKSVVYMVEKGISNMKADGNHEIALVVDFTGAALKHIDFRLPRIALATVQNNYPRVIGNICIVSPPWFFKYVWSVISNWMDANFRSLVHIVNKQGLLQHFDEDNMIEELGGKKKFDFREWLRHQVEVEKVDVNQLIKHKEDRKDEHKDEEVDNLLIQAMQDEQLQETIDKAAKSGYLVKLGGIVKNWKRRYCVLKGGLLRYYKDETSLQPQGTVILERARVAEPGPDVDKPHAFLVVAPLRSWVFVCEDDNEKKAWMEAIQKQCDFATQHS